MSRRLVYGLVGFSIGLVTIFVFAAILRKQVEASAIAVPVGCSSIAIGFAERMGKLKSIDEINRPLTLLSGVPTASPANENILTGILEVSMRVVLFILGMMLVIAGAVWFLQGINVLPGSFMTGQTRWAVYGGIAAAGGVVLLLSAWPRRRKA